MLIWFPTPYPDELLYSVFARYHVRSGNTSPKMTTEELFGKRSIRSVWDLPSNLNTLLSRMGSNWDTERILLEHTMYAYYSTFLLPQQAEKVKLSMLKNKGSTIHTRIGISASNVKLKTNFWVCDQCIEEDIEVYGETYWHRIHQAPCVYACPKHKILLKETTVPVKPRNQHEYITASAFVERKSSELFGLKKEDIQMIIEVAKLTESILLVNKTQTKNNSIREKYLEILKQKNLATINGVLKRENLYSQFNLKFSS